MSDTSNLFPLGYFMAKDDPANLKMREKIALAQMMQKKKVPTNLGEGIYSVGQDIGDALAARSLMSADKEAQAAASTSTPPVDAGAITPLAPAPPITPQAGAPSSVTAAPIAPVQSTEQPIVPASPAQPAPPDVPGAIRMSTPAQLADFRAQNPIPRGMPPMPAAEPAQAMPTTPMFRPPQGTVGRPPVGDEGTTPPQALAFDDRFGAAFPNRTPPVVAAGADPAAPPAPNTRDAIATALVKQQAAPPPPQAVPQAPAPVPGQAIEKAPAVIPGYVPPALPDPTGAPIIQPSKRELQLQGVMVRNQGNPYYAQSPDAMELAKLKSDRELRQTEQNELFKAGIARATKQTEQRQTGLMDQAKRIQESQRAGIEIGDLPSKLRQEGEKRQVEIQKERQQLISPAGEVQPSNDPRLGTPQSPQRTGQPTTPPVPSGSVPLDWAKKYTDDHYKNLQAVEAATPDFQKMLDTIKLAREHPGKSWGTGATSYITPRGSDAYDFSAVVDQLKGKNFLSGYAKIKGGGSVSEVEGTKTEQAQARLDRGGSQKGFDAGLDDMEKSIRSDMEQMQRKVNQPVTAWQRSPDDPPAPDKGQVVSGFSDGLTRIYITGDPSDLKHSWKVVK